MEDFLNQTSKWPIDFHELILVRDVPAEEQLAVKDEFLKLNKNFPIQFTLNQVILRE